MALVPDSSWVWVDRAEAPMPRAAPSNTRDTLRIMSCTSSSGKTAALSIRSRGGREVPARRFADNAQSVPRGPRRRCRGPRRVTRGTLCALSANLLAGTSRPPRLRKDDDRIDPVLYVEFRKDGGSIDPEPWWARSSSEKAGCRCPRPSRPPVRPPVRTGRPRR
jgi:hypothetical protein